MKTVRLAVIAACLTVSDVYAWSAFAQGAQGGGASAFFPATTYGRMARDFDGIIWGGAMPGQLTSRPPPPFFSGEAVSVLQPWAREVLERFQSLDKTAKQATLNPDDTCHPFEMPYTRAQEGISGVQFIISPKIVLMRFEDGNQTRIIYMDQEHPKNLKPSWLGHSVGKWDGDTLVVDTIGYNELGGTFGPVVPHTTQLRTTERIRLVDIGRRLEYKVTYDDPGSMTRPFEKTIVWLPISDQSTPMPERSCEEYNTLPVPMASEATAGKG